MVVAKNMITLSGMKLTDKGVEDVDEAAEVTAVAREEVRAKKGEALLPGPEGVAILATTK
jgi:hypothetical protein